VAPAVPASFAPVPVGVKPPRISSRAPIAVMPEMALVTDIKGECSAAVIKHDVNRIARYY
jgi:hypothetical protein